MSEDKLVGALRINAEGGVTVSAEWLAAVRVGSRPKLDGWTEAMVIADGHSLVFVNENGFATFERTGLPAIVKLDDPSGAGVANLSGQLPGSGDYIELGWTYLLNLPAGLRLMNHATLGVGPLNVIEFRSSAVQFARVWPDEPKLRFIAWTLFAYWAVGQPWPGIHGLAEDAHVGHNTAERYLDRAFAVGLPLPPGYVDQRPLAWIHARRVCVRTLIEAGRFAEWPKKIEGVDALGAGFRSRAERDEFMFVGQALLSLRLRGMGENHRLVRQALDAGEVPVGFSDEALDAIIEFVRNGLPEL